MPVSQPSRIQHTIHLLPQATTLDELDRVVTLLHPSRSAFTYSADAAQAIAHAGNSDSVVVAWAGERWNDDIFAWLHQRGIATQARNFDGSSVPGHTSQPGSRTAPQRIQHTIHLLPQDTTLPELKQVTTALHPARSAFTYSADAAHALMFAGDDNSKVVVWSGERWNGDIFAWLRDRGIKFEAQRFVTPETVSGSGFIFTHWPTEHKSYNQKFLMNPQNYKNPLVGHDGVDIAAPFSSKIFAVASGTVLKVRDVSEDHAYGTAVYLRHPDGYRTAYGHLKEKFVNVGDFVQGGQLIGLADSTGNVFPKPTETQPHLGSHLHLSLYLDGATLRKETPQPFDLIDPEPYLTHLEAGWATPTGDLVSGWAFASSVETAGMVARVQTGFINLRAEPGSFQKKLGRVKNGTVMRLLGNKRDNYYPVGVPAEAISRVDTAVSFGMHNEDGANWMKQNGMAGWAIHAIALGTNAAPQDMTRFEQAGIKMLVRLNYGFHPKGNQPAPDSADFQRYLDACVKTMQRSKGVWGFIFGNETNNPQEYPGGVNGTPITPQIYARAYNDLWQRKPAGVRLGVQAVDPYFGPGSDSRAYWVGVLNNILGADFLTVHPKTQDSNPNNVDSDAKFGDDPLRWQFLHLKSYQPLLDAVPERFWTLPVIATEVNPQRHNDGHTLGWQENKGAAWVRNAAAHFRAYNEEALMPVNGVIFYRFSADDWELHNKPSILEAIKKL
ncbi:MAG: M23 family metallopeptidase [Anaerolineales bacterium]|nr:M23 family metallopeptidase [Anaerolineales bacterium]